MAVFAKPIEKLIREFSKFPGIDLVEACAFVADVAGIKILQFK